MNDPKFLAECSRVVGGREEEWEPIPREKRCKACRLADRDNPRCKKCRELNPPEREAGSEGDEEAAAKEKSLPKIGSAIFDTSKFHKEVAKPLSSLISVAKACGHIDNKGGVKDTPEMSGLRHRLDEWCKDAEACANKMIEKQTKGL